jgi:hypothetical protein
VLAVAIVAAAAVVVVVAAVALGDTAWAGAASFL